MGARGATHVLSASGHDRLVSAMAGSCAARRYPETTVEPILARAELGRESLKAPFADREACRATTPRKLLTSALIGAGAGRQKLQRSLIGTKAMVELTATRPRHAYSATKRRYWEVPQACTGTMSFQPEC